MFEDKIIRISKNFNKLLKTNTWKQVLKLNKRNLHTLLVIEFYFYYQQN
jgi:hypothetical protein